LRDRRGRAPEPPSARTQPSQTPARVCPCAFTPPRAVSHAPLTRAPAIRRACIRRKEQRTNKYSCESNESPRLGPRAFPLDGSGRSSARRLGFSVIATPRRRRLLPNKLTGRKIP
jgi:hypothetical protein